MPRRTTLFAMIGVLVLVMSACASGKDTGFPPIESSPEATGTGEVSCADVSFDDEPVDLEGEIDLPAGNCYIPINVVVKVGTAVTWHQTDETQPHTVTASDGSFDSHKACPVDQGKCMVAGDEFEHTFEKAGKVHYYCKLHGAKNGTAGMVGTVTVQA